MKKLLITTSLVTLFAANVFADAPMDKGAFDLKFTGSVDAQIGSNLNRKKTALPITPNNKHVAMDSEVRLALDLKAKNARGLIYGAHVGIAANTNSTFNGAKHIPNRTFIFAACSDMGHLELGTNEGAADMMRVDAGNIAAATGGVIGDWFKYIALPHTSIANGDFIVNPVLPLDARTLYNSDPSQISLSFNTYAEKARKITYLTPVFEGIQAGVSYIPDAYNFGFMAIFPNSQRENNFEKHAFTGGIWWNGHPAKDHHVKISLTGNYGKISTPDSIGGVVTNDSMPVRPTQAVAIGAEWGYSNFTVAGSLGWLSKTGVVEKTLTTANLKSSDAWYATAGLAMKADKSYTSLTGSWSQSPLKNRMWNVSLGTHYEVAPGFLPYAELTWIDFKQKASGGINPEGENRVQPAKKVDDANSKNTALVLILGTKVKF